MSIWEAVVLGIVEGITEYLPVSSTGHLLLTQRFLGIPPSAEANAFAICIQAGAIVAVVLIYGKRVSQVLRGFLGRDSSGLRLGVNLLVAFLPAAVLGASFDDWIERHLFGLWPITLAWLVGGILILFVARASRTTGRGIEDLSWKNALLIGLAQCVAMLPGTSRSLATILGGLFVGLTTVAAVEFSFLLGLLTLGAATVFKAVQQGDVMLATYGPTVLWAGFGAAWLSAMLAVKWMIGYLHRHGMAIFAMWRIGLGIVVAVLLLRGQLS